MQIFEIIVFVVALVAFFASIYVPRAEKEYYESLNKKNDSKKL